MKRTEGWHRAWLWFQVFCVLVWLAGEVLVALLMLQLLLGNAHIVWGHG